MEKHGSTYGIILSIKHDTLHLPLCPYLDTKIRRYLVLACLTHNLYVHMYLLRVVPYEVK